MTVIIYGEVDPNIGEIDALLYLKKKGEHLLAVKVANYRNGTGRKEDFISDLSDLVNMNGDYLLDKIFG